MKLSKRIQNKITKAIAGCDYSNHGTFVPLYNIYLMGVANHERVEKYLLRLEKDRRRTHDNIFENNPPKWILNEIE